MTDGFDCALQLLPARFRKAAARTEYRETSEEFRLRAGRPPSVLFGGTEQEFVPEKATETDLRWVLDAATQSSFHAVTDQLRRGYVAARGGVRVGVCGVADTDGGVRAFREISSLAVRIPRQIPGAGREIMRELLGGEAGSLLILSPPGGGKTTFLRELVRTAGDAGTRIGLADERGEIAAVWGGAPQFDVGRCTDVLSGAPKAEAAMLLLRAMNPQAVALDEISDPADAEAALRLAGCGVRIFATAHAASEGTLRERPLYRALLDEKIFSTAVVIECRDGRRRYRMAAL